VSGSVVLAARLALDEPEVDVFVNREPTDEHHVFGGLVVAHALGAAAATVDGRLPCSLHASFVVAGAGGQPIRYEVERTRDGSSFSTRRVVARQDHGVVLALTADFHTDEDGVEYEAPAAVMAGPDGLPPSRYDSLMFEARDVPPTGSPPHVRAAWFRSREPLGGDPLVHLQALSMLTDLGATRAAREPHAHLADDARRLSVSLDHAIWFHRAPRVDDWVRSEIAPVSTGRGRGLALGTVRDAGGTLLATFAQEVLLRERR
jgi:acyl-CoA thioesterase II